MSAAEGRGWREGEEGRKEGEGREKGRRGGQVNRSLGVQPCTILETHWCHEHRGGLQLPLSQWRL